jgi:uncharacterized protein (DUF58 family)
MLCAMRTTIPNRAGMSLIELAIAFLLVAFGLVAVASTTLLAQRTIAGTTVTEQLSRAAASVLDSLAVHPHPESGEREAAGVLLRWVVEPDSLGERLRLDAHHLARNVRLTFEARHAPL